MLRAIMFGVACLAAALAPCFRVDAPEPDGHAQFPGWPATLDGVALVEQPMLPREARFYRDLDGKIGKFSNGERQVVMRWIGSRSRKFHMTGRCYKAVGYETRPVGSRTDVHGRTWGGFEATRRKETQHVYECIFDERGGSWPDEAAWRWASTCGKTSGPWWAITVVER